MIRDHDPAAPLATTHRDCLPTSSRYELLVKIASGGMATVYVGRLSGAGGFRRLVAIKRAHAHLLEDPTFRRMFGHESRLASRIHHPNVVAVHDVEEADGELLLIMDYVEGASLSELLSEEARRSTPLPPRLAVRIILDACAGLHAAHQVTDDDGRPLGLVHRDVSPQNILVGVDGLARLADFGVAKSSVHGMSAGTTSGVLKGKVSYMAPEYAEQGLVQAGGDVYALGIVAWEALTGKRLFKGTNEVDTLRQVLSAEVRRPSDVAPDLDPALDDVVLGALARDPEKRTATARDFEEALEAAARRVGLVASHGDVAEHVRAVSGPSLEKRRAALRHHAPPLESSDREMVARTVGVDTATMREPRGHVEPPESSTLGRSVSSRSLRGESAHTEKTSGSRRVLWGGAAASAFALGAWLISHRSSPSAQQRAPAPPEIVETSPAPSVLAAPPTPPSSPVLAPPAPSVVTISRPSRPPLASPHPSASQPRAASAPAALPSAPPLRAPPNPYEK